MYVIYKHNESTCIGICTSQDWDAGFGQHDDLDYLANTHTFGEAIAVARQQSITTGFQFTAPLLLTPDSLNLVADFHRMFEHPILDEPQIAPPDRANLRYQLLKEELEEFRQAIEENDIVAAADALADLQYVLSGAVLEFGLGEMFKLIFEEVQRSNMSKACATENEADATIDWQLTYHDTECYKVERGGKWFVYRKSDNKTIKSVAYSPADIKRIL